ncbi:M67 family metallopeptidase [Paenibacillus filicis]|uniref:M67 family metallopeptidase n=1 Tax=Paenibacillus gyeongsangnamensis TaxID=3388067 RepID=A0ABT4Q5Y2_9BACL|nr:M67 family metallopeptidase [Paenibacillus filicis]MCZ8512095.1 M67 family metallopeptidase [Paenibacillus filicis]
MTDLIIIDEMLLRRVIAHCESELPREACGFLGGVREPDGTVVRAMQWLPVRNRAQDPSHHFLMDGLDTVQCLMRLEPSLELVGLVHSHPRTAAVPSEEDLATEWHTLPSHWIVSLAVPGHPDVRAFAYMNKDGTIMYRPLRILSGAG